MSPTRLFRPGALRSRAFLALPLVAAALVVGACAPPTPPPPTTTTTTAPPGPTVTGEACQPGSGVTVVVDFTALDDSVKIGCAAGQQATGMAALAAAGFTATSESGPGTVCTIDGLPTQGFPYCWSSGDGYWSYWRAPDRSSVWSFAQTGPGAGPIAEGAVEGWSWAPAYQDGEPRVSVADLSLHTPPPDCPVPDAPVLSVIDDDEVLPFDIPGDGPIEVAVLPAGDDPSTAVYSEASTVALAGESGPTRVLARSASQGCAVDGVFDAVYDVQSTYPGRADLPGSISRAVAATSPALVGWASGYTDYVAGADVTAGFQTPDNAVGAYGTDVVVLGNDGRITMTFATPITDGAGDDFAVFENGFTNGSAEQIFTELAYVEVSSNGVDFVRFDSASRQPTPVGGFSYQDPRLLGGLAGKDQGGWGTVFDLSTLSNKPAVRDGSVDLSAITHVRLRDVVGASDYPTAGDDYRDSFGRQIFDVHPTTGSGGFDLRAIGVLNQAV